MFNRTYQLRAVRKAGGGHKVAADAALRLPWAGIFEPWKPLVMVADAADQAKKPVRAGIAVKPCKKSTRQLQLFDGKLRGVQLALFPDNAAENFTPPGKFTPGLLPPGFPSPAEVVVPLLDEDRPLADLFPEAYL